MSAPSRKPELHDLAARMRMAGHTVREIAESFGMSKNTIGGWGLPKPSRGTPRPVRIDQDTDGCWYIYIHDRDDDPDNSGISWWPVRWLKFATREAAEQHLALRGAP